MPFPSRILLVEDELVLAQNLKTFLDRHAPDVRIARNGEQAIDMLPAFTPDVAVLDYGLPGIDGVQTYSEIVRRRAQHLACVMITGYPLECVAWSARACGIRHLLCKPFSLTELAHMIDLSNTRTSHGVC